MQTEIIEFSGWGNAEECTYDIGKHRIEVYVEEYMIYSKDFIVALAPSEKIEKQIEEATTELEEIKKFKWLRGKAQKQIEIRNQESLIAKLVSDLQNAEY